jgi:hypothetical protein
MKKSNTVPLHLFEQMSVSSSKTTTTKVDKKMYEHRQLLILLQLSIVSPFSVTYVSATKYLLTPAQLVEHAFPCWSNDSNGVVMLQLEHKMKVLQDNGEFGKTLL